MKFGTKRICRISENPSERAGATKCFLSREGDSEPHESGSTEPHFNNKQTKHKSLKMYEFKLFDRKTEETYVYNKD